jgi:hypothetical protein
MDNPETLVTYKGIEDEEKPNNIQHNICWTPLSTTKPQITYIKHEPSYKQLENFGSTCSCSILEKGSLKMTNIQCTFHFYLMLSISNTIIAKVVDISIKVYIVHTP